ncbi:LemA family protein [Patescibacteria group bacterium]|nr:LemA family protein [Patescibacteria group bacterium]MBU4275034.1 LemA family protein [Patescibacteria group bacterium]MBU4367604.1 LemA family protein [Patescibacteria group bacterium]MBU4462073.1 LemA family protein [Patescibacteria group bacterium]MCG2700459.1 LemA family protein [Candidatus Parcubacteria bacterium]
MNILYIVLAVLVVILLWIISTYNGLIKRRNRTKEAWADIDVQLKRRYDLIPNLVEIVKGYATHERELFERVTEARTRAMGAKTVKEHSEAENMLSSTLKTLFAVSENYPQLRASENFLELQRELADTENKIQAARRFYNTNVMELNTQIESFPANTVAGIFGFKQMELFEIAEKTEREPVAVKF